MQCALCAHLMSPSRPCMIFRRSMCKVLLIESSSGSVLDAWLCACNSAVVEEHFVHPAVLLMRIRSTLVVKPPSAILRVPCRVFNRLQIGKSPEAGPRFCKGRRLWMDRRAVCSLWSAREVSSTTIDRFC